MSFKSVFCSLQELFPQIDLRVLKAVAIEHCKDADAAVEFILSEVLPSFGAHQEESFSSSFPPQKNSKSLEVHPSSPISSSISGSDEANSVKHKDSGELIKDTPGINQVSSPRIVEETLACSSDEPIVEQGRNDISLEYRDNQFHEKNNEFSESILKVTPMSEIEKTIQEGNTHQKPHTASFSPSDIVHSSDSVLAGLQGLNGLEYPLGFPQNFSESSTVENLRSPTVTSCNLHGEDLVNATATVDEVVVPHGEDTINNNHLISGISAGSNQVVSVEYLEELVADCKNIKSIMADGIDSVMDLMKEVDLCEKEASLAKEEASKAGLDTLAKVKDLKKMLKYAEEANNMHAGEVYGEKSILATEAKELQSRLFYLSEQRHNTLAIIEEIRRTLKARIDASEKERIQAEKEKSQKEAEARSSLEEQETFMNRVVQESKKLHEEALENSKLREFLMDRGSLVDTLQGEISLICEDVLRLKERVDQGLPLVRSLSSSFSVPVVVSSACSSTSSAGVKMDSKDKLISREDLQVITRNDDDDAAADADNDDDGWEYFDGDSELIGMSQKETAWKPDF